MVGTRFEETRVMIALAALSAGAVVNAQQQVNPMQGMSDTAPLGVVARIKIVGNADSYDARRDDTAAKIVVNQGELVKYGDANIADSLKRVPGVTVTSTGRGVDIRMRGLGGGYTQILVNGERAPVGFSIDSLTPWQVERIEVIRSAMAEFSTESVAGTINIVLKKVVRTAQRQLQVGYGGDATERTPRATLLLSDRDGMFSYSVSANSRVTWFNRDPSIADSGTDASGQPEFSRETFSHEIGRLSVLNLIPRLSWTLVNGDIIASESLFSLNKYHFSAERRTETALGPQADYPGLNWFIRTRSLSGKSDLSWHSRLDPETTLELKVGMQGASGHNDSDRIRYPYAGTGLANAIGVATNETLFNTSGKLVKKLGVSHQMSTGWEASRIRRDDINDEIDTGNTEVPAIHSVTDLKATLARASAFFQDEWTVGPNWSIYLGARLERISTRVEADGGAPAAVNIWSPIAQTLIKFPSLPNDQLRFALTRTFKAPDLNSLIPRLRRYEINSATNPDLDGNPGLRSEIAQGVDVTYEHYFSKTALVSVGLSNRAIDDYTLTLVALGNDGRWVGRPTNAGRAHARGLEVEAKVPLKLLNADWPAVELRGSLSRNWSRVEQVPGPHNRMAQQVPLQVSLALDYASGALTTGTSFVFRQGSWTTVTAAQSAVTAYRRDLDLYALWKLNPQQQIRLTLANLLKSDDISTSQYRTVAGSTATRTTIQAGNASLRALFEHKF